MTRTFPYAVYVIKINRKVYPLRTIEGNSMTNARNRGTEIGLAVFWQLTYTDNIP